MRSTSSSRPPMREHRAMARYCTRARNPGATRSATRTDTGETLQRGAAPGGPYTCAQGRSSTEVRVSPLRPPCSQLTDYCMDDSADPCIGFIIHEPASFPAPRKLAILGDTSSAAQLTSLVSSTPGRLSLLVHEATDAHMPEHIDPRLAARRTPALVASKAQERGHSTPTDAGACAGKWGARRLVLNHIGVKWAPFPPFTTTVPPMLICH